MNYKGELFTDQALEVDGKTFDECTFTNCEMIYRGGPVPAMINCTVNYPIRWTFLDSASNTMKLVRQLASSHGDGGVLYEKLLKAIGGEKVEEEPVPPVGVFVDLGSHPTHAIAVAKVCAVFSIVEFHLCNVFAWMLQCPPMHAACAYYEVISNKVRMDMIRGLLTYLHTDEERNAVTQIIEKAQEAETIRNKYAHGLWRKENDNLYLVEQLERMYPHGQKRLVAAEVITNEAKLVERLCNEIALILEDLTRKRQLNVGVSAIKPTFLGKLLAQFFRRGKGADPRSQSTDGEPEPPPGSSPP